MNWNTRTLGDICDEIGGIIRTGPFGSQLHQSDYKDNGLPVIMPKNMIDGKVDISGIARISREDELRLQEHKLKKGDIVLARRGDLGRRALIQDREDGWICGTGSLRVSLGDKILDPAFLFYFLGNPSTVEWIQQQAVGSTMPNLNTSIIRSLPVTFPDIATQRKISSILSAYDDLIENNTRRIQILEEMAQAAYREWFVHFRFPGHEDVPMVDSGTEMGEVPEGWEVKPFSEFVEINPTLTVEKSTIKPFVGMNALSINSMVIDLDLIELRKGNGGAKFQNRDVLFPRITPSVENGKAGFVQFMEDNQVAIGSTEIIVFREKEVNAEFIYFLSREDNFRGNAINSMIGASGRQRVQPGCFDSFNVAKPTREVLSKFAATFTPLFAKICISTKKNIVLRRTRDLLLPKLIGGEIYIRN